MSIETVGNHRIATGAVSEELVVALFGEARAEVSFCDPPWSDRELQSWLKLAGGSYSLTWDSFVQTLCRVLDEHTEELIFLELAPNAECQQIIDQLNVLGVKTVDSWGVKVGVGDFNGILWCGTKGPGFTPSIDLNGGRGVALIRTVLSDVGLAGGSIVFDPCCGEGSTAWAANDLGLAFYGVDVNTERAARAEELLQFAAGPEWLSWRDEIVRIAVARERLRQLHNRKGVSLSLEEFREWERTYFRPRNHQITDDDLAARSLTDISLIRYETKAEIRHLTDDDLAAREG